MASTEPTKVGGTDIQPAKASACVGSVAAANEIEVAVTASSYVGSDVAWIYGDKTYQGKIVDSYHPDDDDDREVLWHVQYDDGGEDDFNFNELQTARKLFRDGRRKRRWDEANLYPIGQPINKTFQGYGRYNGKITALPIAKFPYYDVLYTDGDSEYIHMDKIGEYVVLDKNGNGESNNKKKRAKKTDDGNIEASNEKRRAKKAHKQHSLFQLYNIDSNHDQPLEAIKRVLGKTLSNHAPEVAHFFLFCYERQKIWHRRNAGDDWPWTQVHILQDNFFCNNYRELDRGTNYFRAQVLKRHESILNQNDGRPISQLEWTEQVLWSAVCYRLMNKIETFQAFDQAQATSSGSIPSLQEWPAFAKFVSARRGKGEIIFTGAHINGGWGKYQQTMKILAKNDGLLLSETAKKIYAAASAGDLEGCYEAVAAIYGCGAFFAWQVICDLLECQCLRPCTENSWAMLGPGAKNGIEIIFGGAVGHLRLARKLVDIQDDVYTLLGLNFPKIQGNSLSLKSIEHALCEFQKYYSLSRQKGKGSSGQRKYKSRSHMDEVKLCQGCSRDGDDLTFCDFCLEAYCTCCTGSTLAYSKDSWKCPRCERFEQMIFA